MSDSMTPEDIVQFAKSLNRAWAIKIWYDISGGTWQVTAYRNRAHTVHGEREPTLEAALASMDRRVNEVSADEGKRRQETRARHKAEFAAAKNKEQSPAL